MGSLVGPFLDLRVGFDDGFALGASVGVKVGIPVEVEVLKHCEDPGEELCPM